MDEKLSSKRKFRTIHKFGKKKFWGDIKKKVETPKQNTTACVRNEKIKRIASTSGNSFSSLKTKLPIKKKTIKIIPGKPTSGVDKESLNLFTDNLPTFEPTIIPSTSGVSTKNKFTAIIRENDKNVEEGGSDLINEMNISNLFTQNLPAYKRKSSLNKHFNTADSFEENNENTIKYNIVDILCLNTLLKTPNIICSQCQTSGSVLLVDDKPKRKGLAIKLNLFCSFCDTILNTAMSSKFIDSETQIGSRRPYDVNTRAVASMFNSGMGFSKLENFCAGMNMPPPLHKKTYQKKVNEVTHASHTAATKCIKKAGQIVKDIYKELYNWEEDIIDIAVSYDGTWHTRGHSSLIGVGVVIELMTGFVLDTAVLSKFCQACAVGPKETDDGYKEWWQLHENFCQANTTSSSGGMEVEAARMMWQRSLDLHNLRYTTILSDGDSKAALEVSQVYGEGHKVTKEDCVNHVEKRMGTALRNLVQQQKARKDPIGGKGGLTKVWIDRLTRYYGWAIKDNSGDLANMYCAVWATFFHSLSTDDNPIHTKCPTNSWCKFQRALANNEPLPKHSKPLSQKVGKLLQPIYERLSKKELLEKCLRGGTQNSNESFNSRIWSRCNKSENTSKKIVEIAVNQAILEFNCGLLATYSTFSELKLSLGMNTKMFSNKRTAKRLSRATVKHSKSWKVSRVEKKKKRLTDDQNKEEEEGIMYEAGGF